MKTTFNKFVLVSLLFIIVIIGFWLSYLHYAGLNLYVHLNPVFRKGSLVFFNLFNDWQIVERDKIVFYFQNPSVVENQSEFIEKREKAFKNIQAFFKIDLPHKIDFFVWNTLEEPLAKFKIKLGFASPLDFSVYSFYKQTPGHEITHIFSHHLAKDVRKCRFINEGLAVCFDQTNMDKLSLAREYMNKNPLGKIQIKKIWQDGLGSLPEDFTYPLSGAFVKCLIDNLSEDEFKEFLKEQSYENAERLFGDKLEKIIGDFEKRLSNSVD